MFSHPSTFLGQLIRRNLLFPVLLAGFDVSDTCGFCTACSSVSEICMDASSLLGDNTSSYHVVSNGHHQLPKEYNGGFSLMSSMHANEQTTDGNLQNQQSFAHDSKEPIFPNSAPEPAVSEEPAGPVLVAQPVDCLAHRKYFPPHWSADAISKALEVSLSLIHMIYLWSEI